MEVCRVVEVIFFSIDGISYKVEGRIVEYLDEQGNPTGAFGAQMSNYGRPGEDAGSYTHHNASRDSVEQARQDLFADAQTIEGNPERIGVTPEGWFKRGNG